MNWSKWIRQVHRWLSIAFTLTVVANVVAMSRGQPPAWLTYSPLLPLFLLMFTGLYLFALPYLARRRSGAGGQGAKGYWVVRADVADLEQYQRYVAANARPFAQFGARFLVRAGQFQCPEGTSRSRNVVIEFPSYQAAVDCYASPAYQEAMKSRLPVSTIDLIIIEGYAGPQPA